MFNNILRKRFCARCLNKRSEKGRRKFIKHLQINKSAFLTATALLRERIRDYESLNEAKNTHKRVPYDFPERQFSQWPFHFHAISRQIKLKFQCEKNYPLSRHSVVFVCNHLILFMMRKLFYIFVRGQRGREKTGRMT